MEHLHGAGCGFGCRAPAIRIVARLSLALGLAFASGAAHAQDWSSEPPDWAGAYVGGAAGFGSAVSSSTQNLNSNGADYAVPPVAPASSNPGGVGYLVGAGAGYRWQLGKLVLGSEASFSYGSVGGDAVRAGTYSNVPYTSRQRSTLDWLAAARGNLGYTPFENFLMYATAGLGLGGITNNASVGLPRQQYSGSRTLAQPAWLAGAGVEYKINGRWSAKLEYLHAGFGTETNVSPRIPASGAQFQSNFTMRNDMVLAGINYAFGGPDSAEGSRVSLNGADEMSATEQYFSELTYAFGTRYWPSFGSMLYKLGGATQNPLISELTYHNLNANSGEIYWQVAHTAGPIVKGYAGLGIANGGSLRDQDFPPFLVPYSATVSNQSYGSLGYGALDLGYDALNRETWRVQPYVGYGFLREQLNAYGCTQVATNPNICSGISSNVMAISEDASWNFARLGVAGEANLTPELALSADAAWVPFGGYTGADNHWLRTDLIGPIKQSGTVDGLQVEMALRYKFQDWLDVGVGGRYWQLNSNGKSNFQSINGPSSQATHFSTDRFGPFLLIGVTM